MDPTTTRSPLRLDERWREVVARLGEAEEPGADDLARLAEAHWWLGDVTSALRVEEGLHERLVAEDRPADAALHALRIALLHATRGDITLAQAWLGRATRILSDLPECVVHGYATYLLAGFELEIDDDPRPGLVAARRLEAMAERIPDPTLKWFALALGGMAAVRSGDLSGFVALDEAMIPVVGGRVDALWGGDVFCSVIHLCDALGDVARMRAWTHALEAWAAGLSKTFVFDGVTRIHQLQLLRTAGDWDAVEEEIEAQSSAIADKHGWLAGTGFYELGEIHRLRGRTAEALAAYARARELGIEPQPGEALLHHEAGETGRALEGLLVALAGAGSLQRARLAAVATTIATANGDLAFAHQLADEVAETAHRFGTPGLVAAADRARATCLAADGQWKDAETTLEEAARIYRQQRQRLEVAEVHEALAEVHRGSGDEPRAAAAGATARAIYAALGATACLARLDEQAARTTPVAPGGLTGREVDVLVKVASGLSNKEVARELVISDKTVGRHLSNIFAKTGATTRTGAAAWAREHGLV